MYVCVVDDFICLGYPVDNIVRCVSPISPPTKQVTRLDQMRVGDSLKKSYFDEIFKLFLFLIY